MFFEGFETFVSVLGPCAGLQPGSGRGSAATRPSERMTSERNFSLQPGASCHLSLGYGP